METNNEAVRGPDCRDATGEKEGLRDGRGGEKERERRTRKEKSTSQEPSDLDFTFTVVVCSAKTPRQEMEQLPARSGEDWRFTAELLNWWRTTGTTGF